MAMQITTSRITPFLWLEGCAQEAAEFYVAVFRNARITASARFSAGPAEGSATVAFELDGQPFIAFDGHPALPFTPAISFVVNCDTQEEVDYYWEHLMADGGKPVQCGWLEDKFGVSWQIVPAILPAMIHDPDRGTAVIEALLQMQKPDIRRLQDAYGQG